MIKSFWLAAALLLAAAVPAQAQQQPQQQDSAEQMVAACKAIPAPQAGGPVQLTSDFNSGYCWGAFTSLQSAAIALDERGHSGLAACVPGDTTRVQLIDVFVRYAGGHPELAQKDYFAVALAALRDAYPCKEAHGLFK